MSFIPTPCTVSFLLWELVNTSWLHSTHKSVSSVGVLCACRLHRAALKGNIYRSRGTRETWETAVLLRGQSRDNKLSSFTLLFTSSPFSSALPRPFLSQLPSQRPGSWQQVISMATLPCISLSQSHVYLSRVIVLITVVFSCDLHSTHGRTRRGLSTHQ